jgi:NDP-sugar pyrophosphorylase family protein
VRILKGGVFAAGVGSRLQRGAGPRRPKALFEVAGRPLIEWVLTDMMTAGAGEIVVIVNEESATVRDHVSRTLPSCPVSWIVESTPSSMHSFLVVLEALARDGDPGPFLMSTVDTVAPPGTFARFVDAARLAPAADMVLALTDRIDDDHPLLMRTGAPDGDASAQILAVGEGRFATAGYYLVSAALLREAAAARAARLPALRAFLGMVFARGYQLRGICVPESIDVDRPADIAAAEQLLKATSPA